MAILDPALSQRSVPADAPGDGNAAAQDSELTRWLELAATLLGATSATLFRQRLGSERIDAYATWQAPRIGIIEAASSDRLGLPPGHAMFRQTDIGGHDIFVDGPAGAEARTLHLRLGLWSSRHWLLSLFRSERIAPFSEQDLRLAGQMLSLLKQNFALWRRFRAKAERLAGLEMLINTCDIAVMLLDTRATLLFANRRAEALLATGDGLVRARDTLTAHRLDDAIRLQAAIHHVTGRAISEGANQQPAAAPLLLIAREQARPLSVAVLRLSGGRGDAGPSVAVCVVDPENDTLRAIAPTCQMYALTAAETRLTRYLVSGATLAEAAAAMSIRPQTARAYLKQIFAKVGVGRQTDLVRIMLASAVPLQVSFISVKN